MGVIMACFAEVASQFSEAGGPYLYARAAFGRLMGILVGWMLFLAPGGAPGGTAGHGGKQRVHGGETFAATDGGVGGSCGDDHPSGAVGCGESDAGERVDEGDGSADLRLRWI